MARTATDLLSLSSFSSEFDESILHSDSHMPSQSPIQPRRHPPAVTDADDYETQPETSNGSQDRSRQLEGHSASASSTAFPNPSLSLERHRLNSYSFSRPPSPPESQGDGDTDHDSIEDTEEELQQEDDVGNTAESTADAGEPLGWLIGTPEQSAGEEEEAREQETAEEWEFSQNLCPKFTCKARLGARSYFSDLEEHVLNHHDSKGKGNKARKSKTNKDSRRRRSAFRILRKLQARS